jgi:hypothetical protein
MERDELIALEEKELGMLREFLEALKAERDAIISFSLEGIVRENNRKEEILKRLEYVEVEKNRILSNDAVRHSFAAESEARNILRERVDAKVKEVRIALEKNMKLLTFSMDHVKSSLEKIVDFINRSSYEKGRSISVMVSRKV